jgi:hypothetical protein
MFVPLIFLALIFSLVVAFILARKTYSYMRPGNGLGWAITGSIIVFAISFSILASSLAWLISENVRFER